MKSDPFAPAASPQHIRNLRNPQEVDENSPEVQRWQELTSLHLTDHERTFWDAQDGYPPASDELERRAILVDEYRTQLAEEGPDAEPPTIEDITGHLYTWVEGDRADVHTEDDDGQPDGTTASQWVHTGGDEDAPDPAAAATAPPRNGPGSDTDTWRAFAAEATGTDPAQWATLTRTDIIATLERDGVIPGESA